MIDQLSSKADALDTVIASLRSSDDESVRELLHLARTGRSTEEIAGLAKNILQKNERHNRARARSRRAATSIASLVDDPPIRVPVSPWTSVVDSSSAVSHLISVYFTWQHCAYPAVDQDLFVRDMNSQALSSQFCSPLLVNSLCLVACVSSFPSNICCT